MNRIGLGIALLLGTWYLTQPIPPGDTPPPRQPPVSTDSRVATVAGREFEGQAITADLPEPLHIRNKGGSDGAGMCVMSSIEMAALWAGLDSMRGLRDWCARQPGGAFPAKVDQQITAFCKEKGIPVPAYIQYEGRDVAPLLRLIDKTGRMAGVTYGTGERYSGQTIAHMVCAVRYAGAWGVVLDNNFPRTYEWMSPEELTRRIVHPGGQGWVFAWVQAGPPQAPCN